jgi:pimeloyl-ACP methyl ester carboxylesterase
MLYTGNNLRITINNLTVSYTDDGLENAPSIVFIHGFPLNKSMWSKQIDALKDSYRVITYDVRGHGNTDNGTDEFSIELFVNDLLCFMDTMKIDKTLLCGFSMGGYIALNAVIDHPKRFSALILADTNCTADMPETILNRMRTIAILKEGTVGKFADESLRKLFCSESIANNIAEIELIRAMIVKTSKQSICSTLRALAARGETCSKLPVVKIPVLILVGKEDRITPAEAATIMHDKMKGSKLHVIEHAGHLSSIENPGEFNEQLKKFLSSLKQK